MITAVAALGSFSPAFDPLIPLVGSFMIGYMFMSLKTTLKYVLPFSIFIFLSTLFENVGNGLPLLFFMAALAIYYIFVPKNKRKKEKNTPKLTEDKKEQYRAAGLTDQDIQVFRSTMATLQQQIKEWEKVVDEQSKLKAIDLRVDGLKSAKALFKALVQEPQRMAQASDFIYRHVPNISQLAQKYMEVSNYAVKTSETYQKLADSAELIEGLGNEIKQDYVNFRKIGLNDLDTEIMIAKKNLKIDNKKEDDIEIPKVSLYEGDLEIPDFSMDVPDYSQYLEKEQEKVKDK